MKNKITSLLLLIVFLSFSLQSCEKKENETINENLVKKETEEKKDSTVFKSPLRPNEKIELGKIYTDTVQFVNFDDNGDDWRFIVKKNQDTISLIYNNDDPQIVRGTDLEIKWKMDSLRPAGDPEYLDFTEYLVSSKIIKPLKLADKKIKFLWRKTVFDKELNTDINSIFLNDNYLKTITDPERAVLGYVATFIGNECEWDGQANENRGNLKCKIFSELNLGYQCSNQHLGFLRFWFRNSKDIIKELENCPTTPDGATIQDTFDEINVETSGNKITVSFKANGINMREGQSWNWTEKQFFEFKNNELILLKKEISPIHHKDFDVRGN